jgi:hypothetical protein
LHRFVEQLEPREFLTVVQNASGWTVITPPGNPANGRKIYVSKSTPGASDSNTGLSPDQAVRSLSKAKSLMRDGKADWLLLHRGDTWTEGFGTWNLSGIDKQNPMVISYWDTYEDPFEGTVVYDPSNFPDDPTGLNLAARPLIQSGISDGITFSGTPSHIAVIGLSFNANTYNGSNSNGATGLRAQVTGTDFLVEDCKFDGYKDNVVVGNPDTPVTDFTIRRSTIINAYHDTSAHAQGMYVSGSCSNITIEENTFDHNGWKENVSGMSKTVFNHNMYINTGASNITVHANVITRGSLRGTLLRSGGVVTDNFYAQNAVAIQVGNTDSIVTGNVILQGVDLPSLASGVGIDVAFSIPSVDVENNIVAHDQSAYVYNLSGINLNTGTKNATVKNNIVYDWRRTFINGITGGTNTITNNQFTDFDTYHPVMKYTGTAPATYGNNKYFSGDPSRAFQEGNTRENFATWNSHKNDSGSAILSTPPTYLDPNRDMATYNSSLGFANSFAAWVQSQTSQSRERWDTRYTAAAENNYIKTGFGVGQTNASQTVSVAAADASASEIGPDSGKFTITRTGNISGPLNVYYSLSGDATRGFVAGDGGDYITTPATLNFFSFPAGVGSIDVSIAPVSDGLAEGDETVKLNILADKSVIPVYALGATSTATVTISDAIPTVNVQAPISDAFENDGTGPQAGQFTLTRSGPTTAPLTVNLLFSGSATSPADYAIASPEDPNVTMTQITFPVGADTVNIFVNPVDDNVLEGGTADDPQPGDENVGLSVQPSTATPTPYVPGVNPGATVTIFDPTVEPPPDDGGGGGGGSDPPPLGHGLFEQYYNTQDTWSGTPVFTQLDTRPGFSFTGAPHTGVSSDHFSALWTGQIQPQYQEKYTFYLKIDQDATAKLELQDDTGEWHTLINFMPNHRMGDANDDAVVDSGDFSVIAQNYNQSGANWSKGDFNNDGKVNALDFNAMASVFGTSDPRMGGNQTGEIAASAGIDLDAGVRYNVRLSYSDKVNLATIRFLWKSPSRTKQEVPLDRLYSDAAVQGPTDPIASPTPSSVPLGTLFSNTDVTASGNSSILQ